MRNATSLFVRLLLITPLVHGCDTSQMAGSGQGASESIEPSESKVVAETTQALSGFNLSGFNLSGFNLSGFNLSGFNLSGFNLSGFNLGGTNLGGANLGGTNLGGNNLGGTNLAGTNLSGFNLSGFNLSGFNLSGFNLGGTNLSGSNLGGAYPGMGCPVAGTLRLGTDLTASTVGIDIHSLGTAANKMLYSGEDVYTRPNACVLLGLGSTAFAKLVSQNSGDTTIYAVLKRLNWGFTSSSGGPTETEAWEVIVWGSKRYAVFIVAAGRNTPFDGVAGFMKAIWRWNAPVGKTLKIGQIGGGQVVQSYPGMMDAGTKLLSGAISAKAYMAGELAFVTSTVNNRSVKVDFSSWVRKNDGAGLMLSNVEAPSTPSHAEAVYRALEQPDGSVSVVVGPMQATGVTNSMSELGAAYAQYQQGMRTRPIARRCAGALYLNKLDSAEQAHLTKCDSGTAWSPSSSVNGSTTWAAVGAAVMPHNGYMTIQPANAGASYVACRPTDIDPMTGTCPSASLLPVISETFIHMWEPSFD